MELLEIAKHFYGTDNVIFLLAVNTSELAHSVKSLYGSEFDAAGYLRRFFHLSIQLPNNTNNEFADWMLGGISLKQRNPDVDNMLNLNSRFMERFLHKLAERSLRDTEQAAVRVELVSRLHHVMGSNLGTVIIIALILRTADPVIYRGIPTGFIPEEQALKTVINTVFPDTQDFDAGEPTSALKVVAEATTIAAAAAPLSTIMKSSANQNPALMFRRNSPRLSEYDRRLSEHRSGSATLSVFEEKYFDTITNVATETWNKLSTEDPRPALVRAAEMLELLVTAPE